MNIMNQILLFHGDDEMNDRNYRYGETLRKQETERQEKINKNIGKTESEKQVIKLLGSNYYNKIGGKLAKLNLKEKDALMVKSQVIISYSAGNNSVEILNKYNDVLDSLNKENKINSIHNVTTKKKINSVKKNTHNIDEKLREREIKRLTSPLKYPKGLFSNNNPATDIEGTPVQPTVSFSGNKYILEPKAGVLTDDEILKYAGESKSASKIRLKRDIGSFSDKNRLHGDKLLLIWMCIPAMPVMWGFIVLDGNPIIGIILILLGLGIPTSITLYFYYLKDYSETKNTSPHSTKDENNVQSNINPTVSSSILSLKFYEKQIQELESLYKIKEKFAIELIEKRFTPPQLTYDRFIGVIDSCNQIFYNQAETALKIIEVATEHTPRIDEELKKKLDILKSIVKTIDELTNELAINLGNSNEQSSDEVKDLLEDMQKLADSIKEYD